MQVSKRINSIEDVPENVTYLFATSDDVYLVKRCHTDYFNEVLLPMTSSAVLKCFEQYEGDPLRFLADLWEAGLPFPCYPHHKFYLIDLKRISDGEYVTSTQDIRQDRIDAFINKVTEGSV